MNYNDINIDTFQRLSDIYKESEGEERTYKVINLLYGVDCERIPYTSFLGYLKAIDFLRYDIPTTKLRDAYILNGRKYCLSFIPASFTVAQFQDLKAYQGGRYVDQLSVVLIPEGHEYNDGYDMEQVRKDIGTLGSVDGAEIVRFFGAWLRRFAAVTPSFLRRMLKRSKMDKNSRNKVVTMLSRLTSLLSPR